MKAKYAKFAVLRDEKGKTDHAIATEIGISENTLYDWKAERYQPKIDKLMKLADYFGVSIEAFLEGGTE